MSEFGLLYLSEYCVLEMQNWVYPEIMTLLWEQDKKVYTKITEDGDEETIFEYSAPVRSVIRRLEVMGFSLGKTKGEFQTSINALLREKDLNVETRKLLENFTFDVWLNCIEEIVKNNLTEWNIEEAIAEDKVDNVLLPYICLILRRYDSNDQLLNEMIAGFYYGFSLYEDSYSGIFPSVDLRYILRGFLEIFEKDKAVVMDYTALIDWGSYSEDQSLCGEIEKTVILVEGSSDREILERTLTILYPDLCQYYSFMDFHSSNIAGGATSLVHTLKAFISAGIRNRIIAIFDNDTAASDALRSLSRVSLPETIRIIKLPDLELARSYPTIGPQGNINVDINGLACSIELYFGVDRLSDDNGNLTPVQWLGYNQTMGQYQGEILNKQQLQKKYLKTISEVMNDPKLSTCAIGKIC